MTYNLRRLDEQQNKRKEFRQVMLFALALVSCGDPESGGQTAGFAIPVVVESAKEETLPNVLSLVGTLAANEAVELKSEISGTVEEISFEEGQAVNKGSLLFKINEKKLIASLAQAEANFKLAEADFHRNEALVKNKTISSQEFDRSRTVYQTRRALAELAKRRLDEATVLSPFDGVMGARLVSPGQVVNRNRVLSSIVSLQPMKVEFYIPERYLSEIQNGASVATKVAAYPGHSFPGVVYFISPQVTEDSRTVLVKAKILNPEQQLKPGMFTTVDLTLGTKEKAITVPEAAVFLRGDKAYVFIAGADRKAVLREVKPGKWLPNRVEILSGIAAGERVITEGSQKTRPGVELQFSLSSEQTTRAAIQ